jgi:hypothetical protein
VINHYKQAATLWVTTPNGFGGYEFATPVALNCRWEEKTELVPTSTDIISRAIIYMDTDITVKVGDHLFLDISTAASPVGLNVYKVAGVYKSTDLRSMSHIYKVWLI